MKTYIALLRGINVSGHRMIKMTALKVALEGIGLDVIGTYLQSGNVVFKSAKKIKDLESAIFNQILAEFQHEVPTVLLEPKDLKRVIDKNPFSEETLVNPINPYVMFFNKPLAKTTVAELTPPKNESGIYVAGKQEIYLHYPEGAHKTKLTNTFFEKKLGVVGTSRNWRTVLALYELLTG